jgi:hypothetical protein
LRPIDALKITDEKPGSEFEFSLKRPRANSARMLLAASPI